MSRGSSLNSLRGLVVTGLVLGSTIQALAQQPAAAPRFTFHKKPFFPIALYNYAVAGGDSSQSPSALKEMAAAGFNTLLQYDHDPAWERGQPAVTPAFLTTAQTYGISVVDELWTYDNDGQDSWIGMPSMRVGGSALSKQVNLLKSHPDLLGYETFDEAPGYRGPGGAKKADLQAGHDFVRSLDPDHPILFNANPQHSTADGNYDRTWSSIGDSLSCDWYAVDPTWAKAPWPLQGVVDNMDYLHISVAAKDAPPYEPAKPIYMCLQGMPIAGVAPSYSDSRNILFRTIIHGSAAALWWGCYQLKPTDQMWLDLKRCAGQLRDLEPVLENGRVLGVVRRDAASGGYYTSENVYFQDPNLEAIAYTYSTAHGPIDNYIIVANTSATKTVTSSIAVRGWYSARNGGRTRVLFETDTSGNNRRMIPASGDAWSDTFAPNEVHIYTDQKFSPMQGDFDGDGVKDKVAYDSVNGELQITYSSDGRIIYQKCGSSTKVIIADVDGDGKADIALYQPASRNYKVLLSTTNYTTSRIMTKVTGIEVPVTVEHDAIVKGSDRKL